MPGFASMGTGVVAGSGEFIKVASPELDLLHRRTYLQAGNTQPPCREHVLRKIRPINATRIPSVVPPALRLTCLILPAACMRDQLIDDLHYCAPVRGTN